LPLLRFRPGGVGLDGATRGADNHRISASLLDAHEPFVTVHVPLPTIAGNAAWIEVGLFEIHV
ncbi:hypothetical protein, partial [Agrococcus casei]|uniref:hypothetical protein n=1 Tax=Agrococcus casei TaxID=343512 RepID=UPI003F929B1E